MKLTPTERLILANQFEILEALKPKEAKFLAYKREALERGYESHYHEIFQNIFDGLSKQQCDEVVDILQMHRELHFSYEALPDKAGIEPHDVEFRGFDGNNETSLMAYCRYFCDEPGTGRFGELSRGDDFNSHHQMLGRYRKMVEQWRTIEAKKKTTGAVGDKAWMMNADEIKQVIGKH